MSIAVEPDEVVAGDVAAVLIRIAAPAAQEDLVVRVEAGELGPLEEQSDGSFTAKWTLPEELEPRRLATAAVDCRRHTALFTTLAVARRARFVTTARPGAQVRVLLGDDVVATEMVAAGGQVVSSVLVPPGSETAVVQHWLKGRLIQRDEVNLGTGDQLRAWAVGCGAKYGGDEGTVHVMAYHDSGRPVRRVKAHASLGGADLPVATTGANAWRARIGDEHMKRSDTAVPVRTVVTSENQTASYEVLVPVSSSTRQTRWSVGPFAGYATDFARLSSPSLGVKAAYVTNLFDGSLAIAGEIGLRFTVRTLTEPSNDGADSPTMKRHHWFLPAIAGAEYSWEFRTPWTLDAGVGTGPLLAIVDKTKVQNDDAKSNGAHAEISWLFSGWAGVRYALGPGAALAQLKAFTSVTEPPAWGGPLLSIELVVGYRFQIGG